MLASKVSLISFLVLVSGCGPADEGGMANGEVPQNGTRERQDGGGGASSCPEVTPCGGDVVGTWDLSSVCTDPGRVTGPDWCPTATFEMSASLGGVVEYRSDGTYGMVTESTIRVIATFPTSCSSAHGCDELHRSLVDAGLSESGCRADSEACRCDVTMTGKGTTEGTYTTSGTTLIQTESDPSAKMASLSYCVSGNTLYEQMGPSVLTATRSKSGPSARNPSGK